MSLNEHKVSSLIAKGKKKLATLSEEERDNPALLYDLQVKYFLDPYNDIWEFTSERLGEILSAGKKYVNYDPFTVLKHIAEIDERQEEKQSIMVLNDVLTTYYQVPPEETQELIDTVDEEERQFIRMQIKHALKTAEKVSSKSKQTDKTKELK